jgi:entericidin A
MQSQRIEVNPMKRLMALLLLALFSVGTLTACNTVAGAGKDVQKAGEKVEDAAK